MDRDQNVIVVDRETKSLKFQKAVPWDAALASMVRLSKDDNLIVSDYNAPRLSKLTIPDLSEVWYRTDIENPSKISTVRAGSFGGDYLVCNNMFEGGILEIKDSDGSIAWQNPEGVAGQSRPRGKGTWTGCPHSAFRLGNVEAQGNVTVVGSETDGAILGISCNKEPIFGFSPAWAAWGNNYYYYFNPYGLGEVQMVFPTLSGRIGFAAVSGFGDSSVVGEIISLPSKQFVNFVLAYGRSSTDSYEVLEPPINSMGWDNIQIGIKNTGGNSLDYRISGYMTNIVDRNNYPDFGRFTIVEDSLPAGDSYEDIFSHSFTFYLVEIKSTTSGSATGYDVLVTKERG